MERWGKMIFVAGLCIAALGGLFWLFGDKLRFLGRLPGDIRIERTNVKVFIPITTMILLSLLLSFLLWIIQKLR